VTPTQGVVSGPSWSPHGTHIAYVMGTPTTPNDLRMVDVRSGRQRQLTRSVFGGGFQPRIATPEKLVYESIDGLPISAYLYRPTNPTDGPAPLLMWIHGGPTSQFLDTLHPAVQFFVTRGYALLLPNIRGSSGYGRAFEDLNNQDWGHGDLRDVIAGIEHLRADDTIDTDSVGITGTSYGGIMAMAATVWAPAGVFKAAIACSGYGDFVHLAEEEELRHQKLMDYEYGKLPGALDVYYRCSPIYHVAQAATPCFVLHGEGRYPGSSGGRDFALALERNYKPVWYKTYPGETYYVAGAANVRRQLLDMLAFFDFHLRGIPYAFPDEAERPLTQLSGVIPGASRSYAPPTGGPSE
jgi:dipeptidyl aminopeptidase/acylaminoacyl peptidase